MNNLSWLLYAADVIPNIGELFFVFAMLLTIIFSCLYIPVSVMTSEAKDTLRRFKATDTRYGEATESLSFWTKVGKDIGYKGVPLVLFLFTVSTLAPSSKTIYLIAGSEAGETVVTSEQGHAVLSDVQEIIKLQLEGMKQ